MEHPTGEAKIRKFDLLFPEESYRIKGACLRVHNELGCGFLEKVYENALAIELQKQGLTVRQQVPVQVKYEGKPVGDYVIDLLADEKFIVEVKATEADHAVYKAQLINYLRATGFELGFLVNFGMKSLDFRRVVFTKKGQVEMSE